MDTQNIPSFPHQNSRINTLGSFIDGDDVVTALAITPRKLKVSEIAAAHSEPLLLNENLTLQEIVNCFNIFESKLSGIEIISESTNTFGNTTAAQIYSTLTGPLIASSLRRTVILLRINPTAVASEISRRNSATGFASFVALTTQRVANALTTKERIATGLSPAKLAAITNTVLLRSGAGRITHSELHAEESLTNLEITPRYLPTVSRFLAAQPGSSTLTLSLRRTTTRFRGGTGPYITANATIKLPPWAPALNLDSQEGLVVSKPVKKRFTKIVPSSLTPEILSVPLEIRSIGQLIGSAPHGIPLAFPVFAHPLTVARASIPLVHQLILRAIALGSTLVINTNRIHLWRRLIATIDDRRILCFSANADPQIRYHTTVFDLPINAPLSTTFSTLCVFEPHQQLPTKILSPHTPIIDQKGCSRNEFRLSYQKFQYRCGIVSTPTERAIALLH